MRRLLLAATLAGATALPAYAATQPNGAMSTGTPGATSPGAAGKSATDQTETSPQAQAKLRQDLAQAGFTDIQVMPRSFLVRAKNSAGEPVMMIVNPDSVTAVTQLGAADTTSSASNGHSPANPSGAPASSVGGTNGTPANAH